jgi:hypothetical protein
VIGADILDKTSQNAFTFGRLKEEPSWYQLEESQQQHFEEVRLGSWELCRGTGTGTFCLCGTELECIPKMEY